MAYDKVQPTKITYVDGSPETLHIRKAQFVLNPGMPTQTELVFDQSVITIGTMDDNDIVISDDTASRHHCRIVQEDTDYVVTDLGSTNGLYVNGVRVREAYLDPGLVLGVGGMQIRFNPIDEQIPVRPIASEQFGKIVGRSLKMREMFGVLEKVAPTSATVVVDGETGTGKEVVARTVHDLSKRAEGPMVVFDCGAVPESLIESELFGHEKGSFTGAVMTRKGLFEMANGGTIFLDELGELSLELQPKLLRVLEQREIRRVGSNEAIPVNVRVIAATNRDLEEEVKAGRFREDLFYRLCVVRVRLPALRDRSEDVPLLVRHFLHTQPFNKDQNDELRVKQLSPRAIACLTKYPWPGNVRELLNVIERAVSFADTDTLQPEDLPDYVVNVKVPELPIEAVVDQHIEQQLAGTDLKDMPFKEAKEMWVSTFERDYVFDLLKRHRGNITQAAREADIDRKYFRKLMTKHDIDTSDL